MFGITRRSRTAEGNGKGTKGTRAFRPTPPFREGPPSTLNPQSLNTLITLHTCVEIDPLPSTYSLYFLLRHIPPCSSKGQPILRRSRCAPDLLFYILLSCLVLDETCIRPSYYLPCYLTYSTTTTTTPPSIISASRLTPTIYYNPELSPFNPPLLGSTVKRPSRSLSDLLRILSTSSEGC
jgi:hypothetical protein